MAGRNLFADAPEPQGRNLFAEQEPEAMPVEGEVMPPGQTPLQARAQEVFGFDPNIVQRGTLLPIGRTAQGEVEMAIPQIGVDMLTSALAPGEAARGTPISSQEAAIFAMDFLAPGTRPFNAPRNALARRRAVDLLPERARSALPPQMTGMPAGAPAIAPTRGQIMRAAPTTEQLRGQARTALGEAQATGTVISDDAFDAFVDDLGAALGQAGANQDLHPTVTGAFNALRRNDQFAQMARGPRAAPVSGVDDIIAAQRGRGIGDNMAPMGIDVDGLVRARRQIGEALRSANPDERRLGGVMADRFDEFIDNLRPDQLTGGTGEGVSERLAQFRQLWQRAAKSDTIEAAIEAARQQASGFENGLRIQFRQILRNPRRAQGFTPAERAAMERVVNGGPVRSALRLLGRASLGTNQGTNFLGGTIGIGAGGVLGGPAGAMAAPLIGMAGQRGAERATLNAAELARAMAATGQALPPRASAPARAVQAARGAAFPAFGALGTQPVEERANLLNLLMQLSPAR